MGSEGCAFAGTVPCGLGNVGFNSGRCRHCHGSPVASRSLTSRPRMLDDVGSSSNCRSCSAVRGGGARPRRTQCCKAGWPWAQHSYPSEDIKGFMCRSVGLDVGIECGSRSKYTSNMKASDTSWASSYCCRTVSRSPVSPKPPVYGRFTEHVMSCLGGIMIAHDRCNIMYTWVYIVFLTCMATKVGAYCFLERCWTRPAPCQKVAAQHGSA